MLDKRFVKSLTPPLSEVVPHGTAVLIAKKVNKTVLTVRNAINGASTNEMVVREAIKIIMKKMVDLEAVVSQLPEDLAVEIHEEAFPKGREVNKCRI